MLLIYKWVIGILKVMRKYTWLLLLVFLPLQLTAEELNIWPRELVKGCWVRYAMKFPASSSIEDTVYCLISVHKVNGEKLDLDISITGIHSAPGVTNRIQVNSDNFDVAAKFGIKDSMPALTAIEKDLDYTIQSMKASIKAKSFIWTKNNKKTVVIRSDEIPFGLASLSYDDFTVDVESYSWGNK